MSGPLYDRRPPRDGRIAPVLVTVVFATVLSAVWGFTSLFLDQDVISETDAGPLLGPLMVCLACVIVWSGLWRLRNARSAGGIAVGTTTLVYAVMLLAGASGYSVMRGQLASFALFAGHNAPSPFLIEAALLAGLTILAFWFAGLRSLSAKSIDPPE